MRLARTSRAISSVLRVGGHAAPQALGAPDAAAQALELDDLGVVDEQVDLGAVVLDIPAEHLRVGGLEHHVLEAELPRDRGDHVGAPACDLLGDALGLDHDHVRAGVQADAGAYMIMIESEGITEEVTSWRTDVVAAIARELGLENVMFEAADPEVFGWYVKNYGPEVNLFVDHSQIVQLECLRRGIWGTKSLWGRVTTYPEH